MKTEMLMSLNRRYLGTETYGLATLLDPRFKDKFFSSVTDKASVVCVLKKKVNEMMQHLVQQYVKSLHQSRIK